MVKLLMRFYDVNSGESYVDGHNIKDFNRGDLRELFGMVSTRYMVIWRFK